jgi:hypothetical protein
MDSVQFFGCDARAFNRETTASIIASVVGKMAAERTKSRVTVYYLLAEHYGQLADFVK